MATHRALVYPAQGEKPIVESLPTPTPGPDEVVISIKAVALNSLDNYMLELGAFVGQWPAVAGSDVAGIIESVGPSSSATPQDTLKPGVRVLAMTEAFSKLARPQYGGFQEKVLVHTSKVTPIPSSLGFADAAIIPISVWTTWLALRTIGIQSDTKYTSSDKKCFLVWGASSSIGSAGVQIARSLGYEVYASASPQHHEYLKSLGASVVVDHRDPATAVESVISAAKSHGVAITEAYHAIGDLKPVLDVVAAFGGGKVATAIPPNENTPQVESVEWLFVKPPEGEEAQRAYDGFIYNRWLPQALLDGTHRPSPKTNVVGKGLESLNDALQALKKGVSGEKFVVEL
jgi:NADPH:quinone reductase-like Zn-dependent oxidoreductase